MGGNTGTTTVQVMPGGNVNRTYLGRVNKLLGYNVLFRCVSDYWVIMSRIGSKSWSYQGSILHSKWHEYKNVHKTMDSFLYGRWESMSFLQWPNTFKLVYMGTHFKFICVMDQMWHWLFLQIFFHTWRIWLNRCDILSIFHEWIYIYNISHISHVWSYIYKKSHVWSIAHLQWRMLPWKIETF